MSNKINEFIVLNSDINLTTHIDNGGFVTQGSVTHRKITHDSLARPG